MSGSEERRESEDARQRPRSRLAEFFAELRRRRVFRALVVYAVASFAILQVIEPVMHGLHLPEWVLSLVVVLLIVGFPLTVGLAWAFDLKATGVERTRPVEARPAGPPPSRVWLWFLLLGVAAVAGGAVFALRWWLRPPPAPPSIAVLPFADMSPGKDQEYFADGVAEEILNALAHVRGLRVIGRTSSFSFKGTKEDLRSIGRKLGVGTVLEGSVRRDAGRIRITAQLVAAADGSHLWSETYDREAGGVFQAQDEIARAVVAALRVTLVPGSAPSSMEGQTASPEAQNQYLLGQQFLRQITSDTCGPAEEALRKAIALDPSYARAHAGLARAIWCKYATGVVRSVADIEVVQQGALAAAEKAVELGPRLAEAYATLAWARRDVLWDWPGAEADMERALALGPSDPETLINVGYQAAMFGRLSEGMAYVKRATEADPLSTRAWRVLGFVRLAAGDAARARQDLLRAVEVSPQDIWSLTWLNISYLTGGDPAAALATTERSRDEDLKLWGRALAQHSLGNEAESRRARDSYIQRAAHVGAYQIAEVFAWRGEQDQAFEWLDRCYRERDSGLTIATLDPLLRNLRGDPRWKALLRKMKLPVE